jgi:hypothetical protein
MAGPRRLEVALGFAFARLDVVTDLKNACEVCST